MRWPMGAKWRRKIRPLINNKYVTELMIILWWVGDILGGTTKTGNDDS